MLFDTPLNYKNVDLIVFLITEFWEINMIEEHRVNCYQTNGQ